MGRNITVGKKVDILVEILCKNNKCSAGQSGVGGKDGKFIVFSLVFEYDGWEVVVRNDDV